MSDGQSGTSLEAGDMKRGVVQLDRIAGALVGLAAGDALGAGYEFITPGPRSPTMCGGGALGWEPGEWTDDTQMAICVAEEAAIGGRDPAGVGGRFLGWFEGRPKDVGNQTRAVLDRGRSGGDLRILAAGHFARYPDNAAGNGSLMRTAPVALAHLGDDKAIAGAAAAISALTHGDPLAGEACVLWCIAIDRALRTGRLDGVDDGLGLLAADRHTRWRQALAEARTSRPETFQANGFVVTALQAALASIVQTAVPEDCPCRHLQKALATAVGIGNDTDTVAAIAGGLLGARWGASAIPFEWRRLLHGWPGYRTRDLVRLAILAANEGRCDSSGWPGAESLQSYYQQHFRLSGTVVALPDDPGVLVGDVRALPDMVDDIDVIISLCRVGRREVPDAIEHHEIWLIDSDDAADNPNLGFVLADTAKGIATCRAAGKRVFVHCVHAEARTPTVAAAYLSQQFGMSGSDALARAREALPGARANPSFVGALNGLWPSRR